MKQLTEADFPASTDCAAGVSSCKKYMIQNDELDSYIEEIFIKTKQSLCRECPEYLRSANEEAILIIQEEDLRQMIPGRKDSLLINAHLPIFDDNTRAHKHEFYELVYVHQGGLFMTCNSNLYHFTQGDFIVLNENVVHSVKLENPASQAINILMTQSFFNYAFQAVTLQNSLFADYFFSSDKRKDSEMMIFKSTLHADNRASTFLTGLLREYLHQGSMSSTSIMLNISGLFVELARCKEAVHRKPWHPEDKHFNYAVVLNYMNENLRTLSLQKTASHFHYSTRYFSSCLLRYSGYSFSHLVRFMRIKKAAELLRNTNISVQEIAHMIGYENMSYFYMGFKEHYHTTPNQYRNHFKNNPKT